jgi:hypothetical protein
MPVSAWFWSHDRPISFSGRLAARERLPGWSDAGAGRLASAGRLGEITLQAEPEVK